MQKSSALRGVAKKNNKMSTTTTKNLKKQKMKKPITNKSSITTQQHSHFTTRSNRSLPQQQPLNTTSRQSFVTTTRSQKIQKIQKIQKSSNQPTNHLSSSPFGTYQNPDFHNTDFSPTGRPIHRATTILCVRKNNSVVMIGDGQVSLGPTVVKPNAKKIRRIGTNNDVIVGFAGSTADAFTLLQLLENQLEQFPGQLLRASVETAKLWRTDKMSRHLEAMLIASDENISLCISGNGDVIESHDGLLGIGSGSTYALAAARALIDIDGFDSMMIAKKAMNIAADICVYTNHNFVIDQIALKVPVNQLLDVNNNAFSPGKETGLSSPIPPGGIKDEPVVYSNNNTDKM